ncbi:MAG: DUF2946 domain-containing protein [Telmatospirillum sp.]|nr:DUF2946 domain-containing protein [Telmatospirillum sp.]
MRDMRRSRSPGPTPPTPAFRKARAMAVFWLGVLALLVNPAALGAAGRPHAALTAETIEICTGHGMVLLDSGDGSPAAPASGGDDGGHLCAFCLPLLHAGLVPPPVSVAGLPPPPEPVLARPSGIGPAPGPDPTGRHRPRAPPLLT